MSKGILMVAVLEVDSEQFKHKPYKLIMKLNDATYTYFVEKDHKSQSFGKNYQLLPLANHLQIRLSGNEETDTKEGYFNIPMDKLYELPHKNHIIDVRCVWLSKSDGAYSNDLSAIVKLSVIYDNKSKGNIQVNIASIEFEEKMEAINKTGLYIVCKVGGTELKTKCLEQSSKNIQWNQNFECTFQSIPTSIIFEVLKQNNTTDDVIGTIVINPQQSGYFTKNQQVIKRAIQINNQQGLKVGTIKISTNFKLVSQ